MVGTFLRVLAASSFALVSLTLSATAQDTVRVRGTVERIDGPVYVIKTRDGSEVKLTTVADNPLFVAIVPAKMSDIKPGMYVGSAGTMQ
jgi:intein/homing endonuclease